MGLTEELEVVTALAREAGRAILDVKDEARSQPLEKSDESPVTLADLAADRVIRAGLAELGGLVVTEETWKSGALGRHARVWVVDPLDGTEDFVQGRADYAVQIGLIVDGAPVLGVVHAPETDTTWRGLVAEQRCERVDDRGRVTRLDVSKRALAGPARVAVSVSHRSVALEAIIAELGCVPVWRGSVGLKVGMIVDDAADAYLTGSHHIKVWDTGAPAAVLLSAGGEVSRLDQSPLVFDGAPAHEGGMCAWTPAARAALAHKLGLALASRANTPTP
jgi:3'(2'), 5'-bisphosphate nucleotidase